LISRSEAADNVSVSSTDAARTHALRISVDPWIQEAS
jgi:hypothetical protein